MLAIFLLLLTGAVPAMGQAWGESTAGLQIGVDADQAHLRVSFRNTGRAGLAFVIGGATGVGSMHDFQIRTIGKNGEECVLMDTTVGGVAGYVEPIVMRLAPGESGSAKVALEKLFCSRGRSTVRFAVLRAAGHSVQVSFTGREESNKWGRVPAGWTGTVVSGVY